ERAAAARDAARRARRDPPAAPDLRSVRGADAGPSHDPGAAAGHRRADPTAARAADRDRPPDHRGPNASRRDRPAAPASLGGFVAEEAARPVPETSRPAGEVQQTPALNAKTPATDAAPTLRTQP